MSARRSGVCDGGAFLFLHVQVVWRSIYWRVFRAATASVCSASGGVRSAVSLSVGSFGKSVSYGVCSWRATSQAFTGRYASTVSSSQAHGRRFALCFDDFSEFDVSWACLRGRQSRTDA